MATTRTTYGGAWVGWVVFAAVTMVMIGVLNIIEGIVALVDNQRLVVAPDRLYVVNLRGWGWTVLISGVILLITGLGLFTANTAARIAAIVVVTLHAITQVGWLGAYPVWSVLMIVLDIVVLFALTARWSSVRGGLDPYSDDGDRIGSHAAAT
jgi:hypothetical protein